MNADAQSARDDLAFLRAIVGDDESKQMRSFGQAYFAAGLIYGGQMLGHAAQAVGLLPNLPLVGLAVGLGPTVLFVPVLTWIIARNRSSVVQGTVSRAVAGIFGAIGLANVVLIGVIGSVAWRQNSAQTWLIFPCVVFVLQGTAWLFAYMMRRRRWFAMVAAGWYACAIAMACSIYALDYFILFAGIGLWLCMALPGWLMLRKAA
jgi:hypothetical protein